MTSMLPHAVIERRLRDLGATVIGWSNGAGDRYAVHEHVYDKILVATQGAITFILPATGDVIELRAGDRLDLPAGTSHAATVSDQGVQCLEAHLPARHLGSRPQRVAGWALGASIVGTPPTTETADRTGT